MKSNWRPFSVSWISSPNHSGQGPMTSIDFYINSRSTYQCGASLDRKTLSYWVFVNAFDSHMWPTNNNETRIQTFFNEEVTKTIIHFILLYSAFIFSCVSLIFQDICFSLMFSFVSFRQQQQQYERIKTKLYTYGYWLSLKKQITCLNVDHKQSTWFLLIRSQLKVYKEEKCEKNFINCQQLTILEYRTFFLATCVLSMLRVDYRETRRPIHTSSI